jgi:hypothetical protein
MELHRYSFARKLLNGIAPAAPIYRDRLNADTKHGEKSTR